MTLSSGTRLGPYEILSLLAAGGMGEVYRAKDPRLSREVAIKVLPGVFAASEDRMRRFEHEARAASLLNHPNVLVVFDVGIAKGSPYLVTELLEGETLRTKIAAGRIVQRKALEYAVQIARGVAAAHEKGIVHRDLKPENIFITKDGRVKILDFGLAKLTHAEIDPQQSQLSTQVKTRGGLLLGTVGYLSPEQVQGMPADNRSDIFSFGAILYEMVSGERAFEGSSTVEILNAILKDDPLGLLQQIENFSVPLHRLVRHCLEKNPEDRFQSIRDLGFALEALFDPSGSTTVLPVERGTTKVTEVLYHRITYQNGYVWSARFAPDGSTIVYGASWNGEPSRLFLTRAEGTESLPLSLPDADILSISSRGEMAICLGRHYDVGYTSNGKLAHLPITGGAPREILENVQEADWTDNGEDLVIVRRAAGRYCLEFPSGHAVYTTNGWISHARLSRNGKRIGFVDHVTYGDDAGSIAVVDRSGHVKVLSAGWETVQGLAWSPDDEELWFAAAKADVDRSLFGVSLSGKLRAILHAPTPLSLHDVSPTGKVLITRDSHRRAIIGRFAGDSRERDLSWLNWSLPRALSPDGKKLLFVEQHGAPMINKVCVRGLDGSPPVILGEGMAIQFSTDGKFILTLIEGGTQLGLLPLGPGKQKNLDTGGLRCSWAACFPDGKGILFSSFEPEHLPRLHVLDLTTGKRVAVTEEGSALFNVFMTAGISPNGEFVSAWDPDRNLTIYSLRGSPPRPVADTPQGFIGIHWSPLSDSLYTVHPSEVPAKIFRVNLETSEKELWKEIHPLDAAGIQGLTPILLTPDLQSYVYSYRRVLSDLYVVNGLQ